ncbi:MAG: glycosyltransferase family 2 protein [Nitrospirota bacterium]
MKQTYRQIRTNKNEHHFKNKLSIIIPVFNEANTINEIIKRVQDVDIKDITKEIIIIDDFSTDGTREILNDYNNTSNIKVLFHNYNKGKGYAIRTGLSEATGSIIIIQDADLEYDPNDYPELLQPIIEEKAEIVYGSRILGKNNSKSYLRYYLGGRFLTLLINFLYNADLTDVPTCYKVFKSNIIKEIKLDCKRFEFCIEITAKLLKRGYRIYEVPISYYPRSIEEGKKIRWKDGLTAIYYIFFYRFL